MRVKTMAIAAATIGLLLLADGRADEVEFQPLEQEATLEQELQEGSLVTMAALFGRVGLAALGTATTRYGCWVHPLDEAGYVTRLACPVGTLRRMVEERAL